MTCHRDSGVFVYAASSFTTCAEGENLLALKSLVTEKSGASVRRVGRFIQMALIGAGECLHHGIYPSQTAVYLSSENGDMETHVEVLEAMYRQQQPPKPLSFINTVSNAACFYIGNTFKLSGESSFISSVSLAFDSALSVAWVDLELGRVPAALVGAVDICSLPLEAHRVRIGVSAEAIVGEGSTWLLLGPRRDDVQPLAEIRGAGFIDTLNDLPRLHADLAAEYHGKLAMDSLPLATQDQLLKLFPHARRWHGTASLPVFNSREAHAAALFLQQPEAGDCLLIKQGVNGNISYLLLRK